MMDQDDLHPESPLMTMTNSFLGDGILSLSMPGPSRDSTYYIADGNSVLLVENTLFRVHRSTLTKDKSAFETMFQLSSETDSSRSESSVTVAAEGESDDNPIRLQGDTADEFRALLWSLYALPHELLTAMSPDANPSQLVALARITNKYQFRSLELWALGALNIYYSRPGAFDDVPTTHPPALLPSTLPHTGSCTPSQPSLVQLTELAALCERPDLLDAALARWKRLIGEGKDLALAITVGERFNLRQMLGLAYHAMMLKGKPSWDADAHLTRDQRIRLLCGYYSLAKLWDGLPAAPPLLTHTARCTSAARCSKSFAHMWKIMLETATQVIPTLQREDVLGKVMVAESMMKALVQGDIPSQGLLDGVQNCKENALFATSVRIREIKDSLAEHFTDEF